MKLTKVFPFLFVFSLIAKFSDAQNKLETSGDAGIGTILPTSKLHIVSSSSDNDASVIKLERSTGNDLIGAIRIGSGYADTYGPFWAGIASYGTGGLDQMDLRFYTRFAGTPATSERMRITQVGDVGIGTTSPAYRLDVRGTTNFNSTLYGDDKRVINSYDSYLRINQYGDFSNGIWVGSSDIRMYQGAIRVGSQGGSGNVEISGSGDQTTRISINGASSGSSYFNAGNVGIGTTSPTQKLHVSGNIYVSDKIVVGPLVNWTSSTLTDPELRLAVSGTAIFTKAKVKLNSTTSPWPDYVFNTDYKIPSLPELEKYIKQNNHLPEMPSAADVEKNGIDLGDNQALLLKKIEELTLIIIEQDKKYNLLQGKVEVLVMNKDQLQIRKK